MLYNKRYPMCNTTKQMSSGPAVIKIIKMLMSRTDVDPEWRVLEP